MWAFGRNSKQTGTRGLFVRLRVFLPRESLPAAAFADSCRGLVYGSRFLFPNVAADLQIEILIES